jgi:adenylate cyclase
MNAIRGDISHRAGRARRDRGRQLSKPVRGLIVGLAGAALAIAVWIPGLLDTFEFRTWDWRTRLLARPGKATAEIALILLDQESLDWGKSENSLSWPWPRETYAAAADFCRRGGAKALVFDVLFLEPSSYGVFDDESLGRAAEENGRVVGAIFLGPAQGSASIWPAGVPEPRIVVSGLAERTPKPGRVSGEALLPFPKAAFPIPELAENARVLANTNLSPDGADGVYRRGNLFGIFDGRVVPSMALAAYLAGNPGEHSLRIRPGSLEIDDLNVPIDAGGRAILRFRGPTKTHTSLRAAAVIRSELQLREGLDPELDPSVLRDRYVFFGFSAPGLFDLRPSPVAGAYPGVEIHATMLDNLLSGDFMHALDPAATVLLLLALCAGAGIVASSVSGALKSALVYVLFIPLAPAFGVASFALGRWVEILPLELGTVLTLVGSSLVGYATEGRQKRYIKSAFRQYLSPAVIDELIAHPERLKLGGERRELSIFFSDLQGFTGLSEGLTPEELTALLNEYLSAMTDIIQEEGGTIDKYEGDAIIAFWNAPLEQFDHAVRAVRSALRCQARLSEMRPGFRARVGKDLLMRVGINSGPAVVGNMGSRTRFDYTMLGDAVNLASRLEGINKQFRTYTMVSAAVVERIAGAFPVRELSRVAVVGRREPVTVYEPMTPEEHEARGGALAVFARGLQAFYAGKFEEAGRTFAAVAADDPAAAAYAEKCRQLVVSPPEGEWNGVWVMTSK